MSGLLLEFLKAALGLGAVLMLWVGVQVAWRRAFPDAVPADDDVLAGRMSCRDCTCATPCENKRRAVGAPTDH
jgi:hypothetical protein